MASLFGFEFRRVQPVEPEPSFVPKETDDGALTISAAAAYGTYVDLDGTVRTEAELVTKYREMSLQPEIDSACDEIVNEMMDIAENKIVTIDLDHIDAITDPVKKKIQSEFEYCLSLLDFERRAYEIARRWYIDGRLYYHAMIDQKDTKSGIKEIRYIDPRKIRKVREISKRPVANQPVDSQITLPITRNEYYMYNERGFNYGNKVVGPNTTGLKIAKDSIVHVVSGLTDTQGTMVLSYLHKGIKALNQLRVLEDSLVVYRISRAPERRIWYIDVGNLPKLKAEQYVRDIMVKHKNRLIYDGNTGEVRDDRKFMTMLEDFWLPRREGGRGTEVTTLPGGQSLGQMDDVLYFQKKLYQTLNVPVNRLNSDALFSLGRATEVTRDELKFARFITRLRGRFSLLFLKLLEKQLVLKNVMTIEDWQKIESKIKFDFAKDNYFDELKTAEIVENRINLMSLLENAQMIGRYYSRDWARKNILQQSEDDIEEQDEQIRGEGSDQELMQDQADGPEGPQSPGAPGGVQPPAGDDDVGPTPKDDEKVAKVRRAKVRYQQLMKKANKSLQDEAELKSLSQIVAKNKGIV
jgi:Bacteriophage T4-like portal protein (Gp20)